MSDFTPYTQLHSRCRELALVDSATSLLNWDEETQMPRKALPFRAEQLAFLSGWTHKMFTAPEVGDWIRACEDQGFPTNSDEAANIREWRRQYDRQTKLPQKLVEDFNRTSTLARDAWATARKQSDFRLFRPNLEKLLGLVREMADHWGYEQCRYDALLEGHESGARTAELKTLFAELRPPLVGLVTSSSPDYTSVPADYLHADYPVSAQQAFNREVAEAFGFDFNAGRLDTSTHPFCSGLGPGDTRLTTRYNPRDFTESLYGVLHEVGHGLYDQGLPEQQHGTPLGTASSMGVHESQSRLWENHVGRSREFWHVWHKRACHHFPSLTRFSPQQIDHAVNRVSPSFIRVEADQVTYDLHIILRFDLELDLVSGDLSVADLPGAWNEKFSALLNLKVPDDANGCLQDIHWSLGAFGYFPTYTLGNLNASQLMARARQDLPDLSSDLSAGNYKSLLNWLRNKIHHQGQRHEPKALIENATNHPPSSTFHLDYLRKKFLA